MIHPAVSVRREGIYVAPYEGMSLNLKLGIPHMPPDIGVGHRLGNKQVNEYGKNRCHKNWEPQNFPEERHKTKLYGRRVGR
jgi:hypothetical protein